MSEQPKKVARVKETHKQDIMSKPNVVGVGVGYKESNGQRTDELSVVVLVRQKVPQAGLKPEARVSPQIEGVRTDVIQVGNPRALQTPTSRWRPVPGGVSIGHYQITAGTFGVVVRDRATGTRLILSNNHVLANSNNATIGDPILQPGPADGGQQGPDTIAQLERFHPITYITAPGTCSIASGVAGLANLLAQLLGSHHRLEALQSDPSSANLIDAALARPLDDAAILDDILEIGPVEGMLPAALLMPVRKSGRSTGFTTGQIVALDTTVDVSYGTDRTARFEGQVITTPMSAPGDSGSLLVTGDPPRAVGLLFAGSEETTIHNPIQYVLDTLEVTL